MSDKDSDSHGHNTPDENHVVIDDGMRRWYKSCPCCLSTTYPNIKYALDEEKYT